MTGKRSSQLFAAEDHQNQGRYSLNNSEIDDVANNLSDGDDITKIQKHVQSVYIELKF